MSPEGLKDDEINLTSNGLLTGWIWLSNYVLNKDDSIRERVIIYSEYIDGLIENVNRNLLDGIRLISKRGSTSTAQQVLQHVRAVNSII